MNRAGRCDLRRYTERIYQFLYKCAHINAPFDGVIGNKRGRTMDEMSKRSRKLVNVYRKAVEQREALEKSDAAVDLRSDGNEANDCEVDDRKAEKGKKASKKMKSSKKQKDVRKEASSDSSKGSSKPEAKDHKKGDPKKSDIKKAKRLLKEEMASRKAKAGQRQGKARVAKMQTSNAASGDAGRASHTDGNAKNAAVSAAMPTETIKQFQKQFPYMQNRELSWLEFNKRVLDQGADPTVPLFERLGFISIFWSNLQEFFMIRVGSLTDLSLIKKTIIDTKSGMTPSEQLQAVYARCHELYPYYEQCYKEVRGELSKHGIVNLTQKELDPDQLSYAQDYFTMNVMPFLSPQIINARHPFPHLENGGLYIVVRLDEEASLQSVKSSKSDKDGKDGKDGKKKKAKNLGAEGVTLGLIPLPRQCKRIVKLPGEGLQFMLLEHMIEMFVPRVFSMYKVKHTNVICVTRNADLDATEGAEEQGEDYREHMKRIIKKRARLAPVRLESERELSQTVKPVLMQRLNLKPHQLFVTSVPLNMSYTFELPSFVDDVTRASLTSVPFEPQWPSSLDRDRSIIEQVSEREVLLSYPYETMDAFVQLLREAVADPDVISIKITLYRLAKQSHLAEALIAAADAGKEVTALFELRARFDESNNIEWSQRFDQAGCNVLYGFRDFKVHSKICCITRQTEDGLQYITQLGTGNYNEKTAKLYTDFSFITSDPSIGRDALQFFRNMALENTSNDYNTLWVAPLQIKQNILAGIDDQIRKHEQGQPTGIFFKTNSITDKDIIDKIVEASQAGVKCNLLVRGISCLVPGIEGYTDNVCVDSIVGRLLEHSRIYCFGPFDGDVSVYLSSADLMTRNMDKRIEIAWPIEDEEIRDQVIGYIGTCMADTAKLRDLLPTREYTPLGYFAEPADSTGEVELFDSQSFLIDEAQRKRLEAVEMAVSGVSSRSAIVREIEEAQISAEQLSDVLGEEVTEYETVAAAVIDAAEGSQDADDLGDLGATPFDDEKEPAIVESIEEVVAIDVMDAMGTMGSMGAADEMEMEEVPAPVAEETEVAETAEQTISDEIASLDDGEQVPNAAGADIVREPVSELKKEILPRELPTLDGVPTYEVLGASEAASAVETWNIPNTESGEAVSMHIGDSSYTDPNTKPMPIDIPEEKPSLFKRIFGK